jgi:hypothetical protein
MPNKTLETLTATAMLFTRMGKHTQAQAILELIWSLER